MLRQHLDCHGPFEPRVPRLVHLPHPARAQRSEDLVGTELCSGGDAHRLSSTAQSRTTVMGGEERPSGSVTVRKRCPSGVTAYRLWKPGKSTRGARVWKSGRGADLSKPEPSVSSSDISFLSSAR